MTALIGVLGGGQLGRMLALAGYPLGLRFRFLDPARAAPAGRLAEQIVGGYDDLAALERFAAGVDAVTYEFENVPVAALERLAHRVPVRPGPAVLAVTQDRLAEKDSLRAIGVPVTGYARIESAADLERALAAFLARDAVEVPRRTKNGLKDVDARAAVTGASAVEEAGCAILKLGVRQVTPAVRPDDVLAALAAVADLRPPLPARAVREAQGRLDDNGTVADPLGPDRAVRTRCQGEHAAG